MVSIGQDAGGPCSPGTGAPGYALQETTKRHLRGLTELWSARRNSVGRQPVVTLTQPSGELHSHAGTNRFMIRRLAFRAFLLGLFLATAAGGAAAQDRPWYNPGSRMVNLHELAKSVSDTTGIPLVITMPPAADAAGRIGRVGQVFAALASAYVALKIPAELRDSGQLMLGNVKFQRRTELGGRSLALYLECGHDINGVYAENYPIALSLVSFLTPVGRDEIEVRTVLLGTAVDIPRAKPNTAECGTTGELERRIYQMTLKALGKGFVKSSP